MGSNIYGLVVTLEDPQTEIYYDFCYFYNDSQWKIDTDNCMPWGIDSKKICPIFGVRPSFAENLPPISSWSYLV